MKLYDVIIIGLGPAGCSAGIYATRYGLSTLIVGKEPGGQANEAYEIDNYPGMLGVKGIELMNKFREQAKDLGADIAFSEAVDAGKKKNSFLVKVESGEYEGRSLIIATGSKKRRLGIPGEKQLMGRGISYCATCLPPSENVIANNSTRAIDSIKSGERVLTIDGTYKHVKDTMKRNYSGKLMEIRTKFFTEPVLLTPEHPVLKMNIIKGKGPAYKNFRFTPSEWVRAEDLSKNDVLFYPVLKEVEDKDTIRISDFIAVVIDKNGYAANKRETYSSVRIKNIISVNREFMRLIGYYLAEGCVTSRGVNFYFSKKETDYIEDVKSLFKKIFGVEPTVKMEKNVARIMVFSYILRDFFELLFNKYSYRKSLPHWINVLPPAKQQEIIKGFWRGDGCIRDKDFCLVTNSKQLVYQFRDILLRLGIIPSINIRRLEKINKKPSVIGCRKIYFKHDKFHIIIGGPSLPKMSGILGVAHKRIEIRKNSTRHALLRRGFVLLPIRDIEEIGFEGEVHNLSVEDNNTYVAKNFIVHNCDAPLFRGKVVAVIGGGTSAMMAALMLTEHAKKVYLVYRGEKEKMRAMPAWIRKAEQNKKIEMVFSAVPKRIDGSEKVESMVFERNGKDLRLKIEGVFVEVGSEPQSELAKKLGVAVDKNDKIKVANDMTTNVKGIFAAGDVTNGSADFEQIITSAAEGANAARSAYAYLRKK